MSPLTSTAALARPKIECFVKPSRPVHDNMNITLAEKIRFLKADAFKIMLIRLSDLDVFARHFRPVAESQPRVPAEVSQRAHLDPQRLEYKVMPYRDALVRTGWVALMHDERLPNIVVGREMDGGEKKACRYAEGLQHRIHEDNILYLLNRCDIMDANRPRCFRVVPGGNGSWRKCINKGPTCTVQRNVLMVHRRRSLSVY